MGTTIVYLGNIGLYKDNGKDGNYCSILACPSGCIARISEGLWGSRPILGSPL